MRERATAVAVVLAVAILPHCVLQAPGIAVELEAAPDLVADARDRDGQTWGLGAIEASALRFELLRCPGRAAWRFVPGPTVARAHDESPGAAELRPIDLRAPSVLALLDPSPGRYCDLRVTAPAGSVIRVALRGPEGREAELVLDVRREVVLRLRDGAGSAVALDLDAIRSSARIVWTSSVAGLLEDVSVARFDPIVDGAKVAARIFGSFAVHVP